MTSSPVNQPRRAPWTKADVSRRSPWTKAEIRAARQAPLKPVLERLGYTLIPAQNGNYLVEGVIPETTVKEHYWVQASTNVAGPSAELRAGNAIDFLVKIRRLAFSEAMELLTNIQRERIGQN